MVELLMDAPVCMFCSEEIGPDDRVIAIDHDETRVTTLACEPQVQRPGVAFVHVCCAPRGWSEA